MQLVDLQTLYMCVHLKSYYFFGSEKDGESALKTAGANTGSSDNLKNGKLST